VSGNNREEGDRMFRRRKAVKKIDGALLSYIVTQHGGAIDVLQHLRRVECDVVIGGKPVQLIKIRIFHPAMAKEKGIAIYNYKSLDNHPELILYEGYYQPADSEATNIRIDKK